jgi:hypothetical protein
MEAYRAVYVVPANTSYGRWIRRFWQGDLPKGDPLYPLLHPDQRGEVHAWGAWPHWTCLDALTVEDPDAFDAVVKTVCGLYTRAAIRPTELAIYGDRTALAVASSCPPLKRMIRHLVDATRHLVARSPITDEEWQRAAWWIEAQGRRPGEAPPSSGGRSRAAGRRHASAVRGVEANRTALLEARKAYLERGAPPLPRCRHFRLGFLIRLWKELKRAGRRASARRRGRHLDYFLTYGEPPWYEHGAGLHTTIASGLHIPSEEAKTARLREYNRAIWPKVQAALKDYRPRFLAIMGEHVTRPVTVRFYDWLTEQFIEESRPRFRVVDRAYMAEDA